MFRSKLKNLRVWTTLASIVGIVTLVLSIKTIEASPPAPQWLTQPGSGGLENEDQYKSQLDEMRLQELTDSSGMMRPDLWLKGVEEFRKLPIASSVTVAGHGNRPDAINGVLWTQIGPAPLHIDAPTPGMEDIRKYQGVGPDSGEVTDIAIDPRGTSDSTIYIATNDGGIWKTTDGGNNWTPKTESMPSLAMGAVALDPNNPDIVYAGTGNPFDGRAPFGSPYTRIFNAIGIYRSVDGGNTWTISNNHSNFNVSGISRMVVPASDVLLVATTNGLYRSIDGGQNFGSNAPYFNNYAAVFAGGEFVTDLDIDNGSPPTIYASVYGRGVFASTDNGITFPTDLFTSTNGAPTGTFKLLTLSIAPLTDTPTSTRTPTPGGVSAALAPGTQTPSTTLTPAITFTPGNTLTSTGTSTPTAPSLTTTPTATPIAPTLTMTPTFTPTPSTRVLYASVQGNGDKVYSGLYKSINGGAQWARMTSANAPAHANNGCQCNYDLTVGADPQDANRVYIGFQELYRSTTGGSSFSNSITYNLVHMDHHALVFSPRTHWGNGGAPSRLWVGTDGGIATSSDGGTTWTNKNGAIASNLFYNIDMGRGSAANNAYTYGGQQDTGIAEHRPADDPGTVWHMGWGGDSLTLAVNPENPLITYATTNGFFQRTTDAGVTWSFTGTVPAGGVNVIAADATTSTIVYAATNTSTGIGTLYKSVNSGVTFASTFTSTFISPVTSIATARGAADLVWIGLKNGAVQRSTNGGTSWSAFNVTDAPTGQAVEGIAIYPSSTLTVAVVYPGFNGAPSQHVFLTTNGGATWSNKSGNLPDLPLHSVVFDTGTNPPGLIVASNAGVARSTDMGTTWQALGVGLPSVDSRSLAIDASVSPSILRIGTYGRSVFELKQPSGPRIAVKSNLAFGVVSPNTPVTRTFQIFSIGSTSLNVTSISRVAGSSNDFQIIAPPPPPPTLTLASGAQITFTVAFTPTHSGAVTATFQINSDDPTQPALQIGASGSTPATYHYLRPQAGSPPNGGTINVGNRINFDMMISSGTYTVTQQRAYLAFTNSLIQNVDSTQPLTSCVVTNTLTPDLTVFDFDPVNRVCNGPGNCGAQGPGLIDYYSFVFANPAYNGADFRVAQLGFCATAPGLAIILWQGDPPDTGRDTEIIDDTAIIVNNFALYTGYYITIIAAPTSPTTTPTVTPTRTDTPTPTATPTNTPTRTPSVTCGVNSDYLIIQSAGAVVPGTTDIGNHCDDCMTTIALPFSYQLYDQTFSSVNVSSNGNLQFLSSNAAFGATCLPHPYFDYSIMPHWDDLLTGCHDCGVFTSVSGTAPNRIFNIEWRVGYIYGGLADFEARLYEGQSKFDFLYDRVDEAGYYATVGVQRDTGSLYTEYACLLGSLYAGLQLTFYQPVCPTPTVTATATATPTSIITPARTNTLLVSNTPTRTLTPIVTPTPTTVAALLVGHTTWQGRPAQPNALQQLGVTLTLKLGATEVNYAPQTTDSSGFFTVTVNGLPSGIYTWRVKGPDGSPKSLATDPPGFLANSGAVFLPGSGTTLQEMGQLRAGDCTNDNVVSVGDFNILKNAFGKSFGDPGYDSRADYTGDAVITVSDFNLQKGNFGQSGASPITPWQQ